MGGLRCIWQVVVGAVVVVVVGAAVVVVVVGVVVVVVVVGSMSSISPSLTLYPSPSARNGHKLVVEYLWELGKETLLKKRRDDGRTALMSSIVNGDDHGSEIMELESWRRNHAEGVMEVERWCNFLG